TGFKTGVKIRLSGWSNPSNSVPLGLTVYLTIALEGRDEEVVFDVAADEHDTAVRRLDWPPPLDSHDVDYTVLSNIRGILLPRDWPHEYSPIRDMKDDKIVASDKSEVQSNIIECWSMAWWGFLRGRSGMMIIIETPDDAAYQFSHPAGGPTIIGPRWREQLGHFGYPRSARMCFVADGDYVDLAKRYRRYVMDSGQFVSLEDKIARSPAVKQLIGTPLTRLGILRDFKPGSRRYGTTDPAKRRTMTSFDQRVEDLRALKTNGIPRLQVCLTGWPHYGYDRQHPDELPPAPDAGGYEGMKRLADACHELGYVFSLHDQYRDYYLDAPSFVPHRAVHEEDETSPPIAFPGTRVGQRKDGAIPVLDYWDGGAQAYLNSRFKLGHLLKNYEGLFDHGVHPDGIYLDVFGYVPPDEDFNPEHPTTRTQAMKDRAACCIWARRHLGIVGTEAGCDWLIPYADFSSPLDPPKAGIPVPLFDLVYHDAIITPHRSGDLCGLLEAGVPQGDIKRELPQNLKMDRQIEALHERVGLLEMTKHEFLDASHRKERTIFADGTTVTVDWDSHAFSVMPELKLPQ